MGKVFGVPYENIAAQFSISTGFFLVGFDCGMATWGIYGVVVIMKVLAEGNMFQPDYTAPVHCGGTQFFGNSFCEIQCRYSDQGRRHLNLHSVYLVGVSRINSL
ncbi:hypothetical protein [Nitrosomonas supralitoralis]|uniref:Uncharacterized protein n=1 Tax=Nitrosomonas supralitoralis TaxID=2116706 RepID=A0A2P7NS34_9PROT|nr:hypothetical protein [Nitrosomonas supralitoralis]PSJ16291.1 hypothetical protein C7H79_14135 [Nitrosomonas supralitoralis]